MDPRHRLALEVLCCEDHQVGGATLEVLYEGHYVAVVLSGIGGSWCEHCLARRRAVTELVRLDDAVAQVVFEQGVAEIASTLYRAPSRVWPLCLHR